MAAPAPAMIASFQTQFNQADRHRWCKADTYVPSTVPGEVAHTFMDDMKLKAPTGKRIKEFLDVVPMPVNQIPDVNLINAALETGNLGTLPDNMKPKGNFAEHHVINTSIINVTGQMKAMIRVFHIPDAVTVSQAKLMCRGQIHAIKYDPGANSEHVRIATYLYLKSLPGNHYYKEYPIAKLARGASQAGGAMSQGGGGGGRGKGQEWDPAPNQLRDGIAYINMKAPLANAQNEQYLWILLNVRDEDSPIYGWPEGKVQRACTHLVQNKVQAAAIFFFPLLLMDMKATIWEQLVPLLFPWLMDHGLIILGVPNIGKTPMAIMFGLALSRHIIHAKMLEGEKATVRKCKQMDGLRDNTGKPHEVICLDDFNAEAMHVEDIKATVNVIEERHIDCRYHPVKLAGGQPTFLINNILDSSKEPGADHLSSRISWDQFYDMISGVFNTRITTHIDAIMKRSAWVIAGNHAMYARVPGTDHNIEIHRFTSDSCHEDFLRPDNKSYLTHFRQGRHVKYPGYDDKVKVETEYIDNLFPD